MQPKINKLINLKKEKEIVPILCNFFQRIEAEGTIPNSFYEASVFLIPKPDANITYE